MSENIFVVKFKVESETYQALSELKYNPINEDFTAAQAGVAKNEGGHIVPKDCFDTGAESKNDMVMGGLMGALIGVMGGPVGMLICGTAGALLGSTVDANDNLVNATLIEQVCSAIPEGETALVALVSENNTDSFEKSFAKFECAASCFDAAEVAEEIKQAQQMQDKLAKEARDQLRREKKETRKERIEEHKAKIKSYFESIKAKFKKSE